MLAYKHYAVIFAIYAYSFLVINAYPTINIRRFFDAAVDSRYKKSSDLSLPKLEDDVLELEELKHSDVENTDAGDNLAGQEQQQEKEMKSPKAEAPLLIDNLPELERQLELATSSTDDLNATLETLTKPTVEATAANAAVGGVERGSNDLSGQGAHRPPMLQQNDGGKAAHSNQQQQTPETQNVDADGVAQIPLTKPFYGAARLAFGQNPEVLPTTTSSTTTTNNANTKIDQTLTLDATSVPEIPSTGTRHTASHPIHSANNEELSSIVEQKSEKNHDQKENSKEFVSEVAVDELKATKSSARRSVTQKTAESLLRHKDGQYSAFDMAQYVFWTGDEVGVARAVEEFIEQGLMSRENALQFLRDIRIGIEYLQRSYSNRIFPEEIRDNNIKKSFATTTTAPPATTTVPSTTTATTTTPAATTTTSTTEKPFPPAHFDDNKDLDLNLHQRKTDNDIATWNKLQEVNKLQEIDDYDEVAGRARIAEFLYTEYTLEEILYKLAKVMFTQSLAQGSGEAQRELHKLTDFLEHEGNRGIIPLDLQKKVLHVLLKALSDTLVERPELLPAARLNLGNSFNSLPNYIQ